MSRWLPWRRRRRLRVVLFEVTARCNNRCLYCYNVWKLPGCDEPPELPTPEALDLLRRVMAGRRGAVPGQITFTGGEPLLRDDLERLVAEVVSARLSPNLITNGRLLGLDRARSLVAAGCRLFEIPLLAPFASLHDELAGSAGAFEGAVRAIGAAKSAGAHAVVAFVATRRNIDRTGDVARLALALGADGLMFLRFNPGGAGSARAEDLLPTPAQIVAALGELRAQSGRGGLPCSVSVPLPPCVIDPAETEGLGVGFCSAGTENTYLAVSPNGDVRPCNHSPAILGNVFRDRLDRILDSAAYRAFCAATPAECSACPHLGRCRCGCKAAAEACLGDVACLDPLARRHGKFPWLGGTRAMKIP